VFVSECAGILVCDTVSLGVRFMILRNVGNHSQSDTASSGTTHTLTGHHVKDDLNPLI